ncbi:hypothetical protein LJK88_00200 [Paenibacillus sp. P26]|nr:hypothetical protein LJK88_00200 [Paenibacillus sp. P26]
MPRLVGFEVGQGQAADVRGPLEEAADWDEVLIVPDLAGIDRHVIAYQKNDRLLGLDSRRSVHTDYQEPLP